ncbi:dephospho-CoA kinase [Candidatus Woesearchaeota archaeon]|nr:dephospho-CoA kinase [Candidatus Woesearchaeota archaeon]
MIIGITGSIGSGKTAAAKIFSKYHYIRIDADEVGHSLMKENKELKNKLIKNFGNKILGKNGNIDRKKLGGIIFNDKNKLKKLNSIMHPLIINEIKNKIKNIQTKCGLNAKIIIDAPLLIETNLKDYVDKIIVIKSDKKNIIKRLNKKFPKKIIERILKAQMPLEEKLKYADFVVENNRDLKNLEKQVKEIINYLKNE